MEHDVGRVFLEDVDFWMKLGYFGLLGYNDLVKVELVGQDMGYGLYIVEEKYSRMDFGGFLKLFDQEDCKIGREKIF